MTRTAEESHDDLGDPRQVRGGAQQRLHVGGATSSGIGITVNTVLPLVSVFL